jgi:hypothetical protein
MMGKMSPEMFRDEVFIILENNQGDTEARHAKLDDLMEELLVSLGYGEGVKVIRSSERWYA